MGCINILEADQNFLRMEYEISMIIFLTVIMKKQLEKISQVQPFKDISIKISV